MIVKGEMIQYMMNRHHQSFYEVVKQLLSTEEVQSMLQWKHHAHVSCFDHSLFVAYSAYRTARLLRLNSVAVARAALLHDLYLYDPKDKSAHPGNQCFDHPRIAAENAQRLTELTEMERNIILSHMWPLGGALPRSVEAFLVDLVDTICAGVEFSGLYCPSRLREKMALNLMPEPA